jgi:hypothetical protein
MIATLFSHPEVRGYAVYLAPSQKVREITAGIARLSSIEKIKLFYSGS